MARHTTYYFLSLPRTSNVATFARPPYSLLRPLLGVCAIFDLADGGSGKGSGDNDSKGAINAKWEVATYTKHEVATYTRTKVATYSASVGEGRSTRNGKWPPTPKRIVYSMKKVSIEALSESSRKQEKTMKMCHIEHNGSNLLVQTPQIDLGPYGVNFYENTKTIRLPVENVGDDFKKMIDKLEKYCQNNVESIVNGTFEEGKPDEFEYKSFAKTSDNDKFPSYYKVAVGYADTLYPSVFRKDEDGEVKQDTTIQTNEDLRKAVNPGSTVKMIVQLKVWVDDKQHYGISASCKQLLIVKEGKKKADNSKSLFA
ncbi:hypothetical protein PAPYR_10457 [Paratrimastix pyriformis]|uniref:Uncharacterized protein n=1 Tax=Paratrimastix pyriformis TaxID=342808 RepID=A0ABQ8U5Y4_9EUKA|nr:hypothetical protein PAPYR_10457 [Paratrimastix pyriformis]